MRALECPGFRFLALVLACVLVPAAASAQAPDGEGRSAARGPTARRDGQHDFDFLIGRWKYHLSRLERPLTGSTRWVEFEGTGVCRPVWGGLANLDELEVDGPAGRIEGLTLRLYNPQSHQWSLYWGNAKNGALSLPPTVGAFDFKNGRGEFFDQETYEGRTILVRYVWSDITATSAHFEQSFSDDGGRTWEPNWITTQVRVER